MMQYWGFDLGDGESAVARVTGGDSRPPEIMDIDGKKIVITVWAVMPNGEVRIGEAAARAAASAVRSAARFKGRFLTAPVDSGALVRDFSARVFESLRGDGSMVGGETANRVYVGCPAGWDGEARDRYRRIFDTLGLPGAKVVSESRAVMVGAVQSNSLRDYVDLREKSVLVVDIGSSTTDFAYICKGKETEIRTGGEVALGGGIMDEVLLEACVASSPDPAALRRVLSESESWRVDCELKARQLKEKYYSLPAAERDAVPCRQSLLVAWEEPLILDLYLDRAMSRRLTEEPCSQLGGRSFGQVFREGLRQVRESIGGDGPELLFLTGGVSRMEEVRRWCAQVFPEAVIYTDREPEFSVARGLAWCGRIDDDVSRFRGEVAALIESDTVEGIISRNLNDLYRGVLDQLLDPLMEKAVRPALVDWRAGRTGTLKEVEAVLQDSIRVYLSSEDARGRMLGPVTDWLRRVTEELEEHTGRICRTYRVPERSLGLSSMLTASDFQLLERVDAKGVLSGDTLTWTAVFVESVISILVAMLCGGSGVVLISEGPVGLLIGFILSFVVLLLSHAMGKDALDEKLMSVNLPLPLRKMALASILPKVETPGLRDRLGLGRKPDEGDDAEKPAKKSRVLPRIRWTDRDGISDRRMEDIKRRIRTGYDRLLDSPERGELQNLDDRLCKDISGQIESRLRQLAEQVEIPL